MKKKIAVGLTAAIVLLTMLCTTLMTVSAAGNIVIEARTVTEAVKPGDEFKVDVVVSENPGIVSLLADVNFDSDVFEVATELKSGKEQDKVENKGVLDGYFSKKFDTKYRVAWADWNTTENITETGVYASIYFKVKDTAENGTYTFSVTGPKYAGDISDYDGNAVPATFVNCDVTVDDGLSKDCTLKSLAVSAGTLSPAFAADVTEYSVVVPYGSGVPTVTAAANDAKATVNITQAADFASNNKAVVKVTAEKTTFSKVYTITFTEQERTAAPVITTDNSTAISRKNGKIEITGSGKIYYTTDGTAPTESSAEYTAAIDVSALNFPLTTTSFTVKAVALEDGKAISAAAEKTFSLADTNISLSKLTVNGESVSGFSAGVLEYVYEVAYADWKADPAKTYKIAAEAEKATSAVVISSASVVLTSADPDSISEKAVTVSVTSENGDRNVYKITFKVLACPHSATNDVTVTEPDCTNKGSSNAVCTVCGKVCGTNDIPALGHAYNDGVVTTEPGCETEGVKTYTCARCGDKKTESVPATGHNMDTVGTITTEPTCTADGVRTFYCSGCDKTVTEPVPALGHAYNDGVVTTKPGCETEGVKTYTCTRCGDKKTESVPATGHNMDSVGTITTEPTCTADGVRTFYCSGCDKTVTEPVPALGHAYDDGVVTTKPGCETEGVKTYTCTRCGDKKTESVPATGHNMDTVGTITTEPTCTADGVRTFYCSGCDKTVTEPVPALGHAYDDGVVTTEPGCETEGVKTYTCTRCGDKKTETVPVLGHDWSDDVSTDKEENCTEDGQYSRHCNRCDKIKDVVVVPALGHTWSEWTVSADGITYERVCSVCGAKESKVITNVDHVHFFNGITEIITEPTCTSEGSQNRYCSVDGCREFVTESVAKKNHTPGDTFTTDPTCTASGHTAMYCADCGLLLADCDIPAIGHSFTNYTGDTATCISGGTATAICDNGCGAKDVVDTPAKGHIFDEKYSSDASGHWHNCTVCGARSAVAPHSVSEVTGTDGTTTFVCSECGYVTGSSSPLNTNAYTGYVAPIFGIGSKDNEPNVTDDNSKSGWKKIIFAIKDLGDEGTVEVNMNDYVILPKNVVEAIKGKNIDLVLHMANGVDWIINGKTVGEPKKVNMQASFGTDNIPDSVLDTLVGAYFIKQFNLAYSGKFNFEAGLRMGLGTEFDGKYANVFYYNEEKGVLEFICSSRIKDGYAIAKLTHASEYAVAISDEPMGSVVDISSDAELALESDIMNVGGGNDTLAGVAAIVIIAAASAGLVVLRKKQK